MIVVDSSAVIDALVDVPGTEELRSRLAVEDLHAPTLVDFEVVSVLRGMTLGGQLSVERCKELLADFDALLIRRWPSAYSLRQRAFQLRHNATAYDAAYLVLAETLECPLVTRDKRLARASGHTAQVEVF